MYPEEVLYGGVSWDCAWITGYPENNLRSAGKDGFTAVKSLRKNRLLSLRAKAEARQTRKGGRVLFLQPYSLSPLFPATIKRDAHGRVAQSDRARAF